MIKLLFFASISFFNAAHVADSLGIETVNGKTFVIHKVDEKETLFAISRRYGTTVDEIIQYNTTASQGLEIGQILKVPYTPKQKPPSDAIVHKVAAKETLFSISKTYGVTIDELKQWNNLSDNSLVIGQDVIVRKKNQTTGRNSSQPTTLLKNSAGNHTVAQNETMYSIARQYGITIDQLKSWNKLQDNDLKIGQMLVVAAPATQSAHATKQPQVVQMEQNETVVVQKNTGTDKRPASTIQKNEPVTHKSEQPVSKNDPPKEQPITISESTRNGDEIVESGLAELIEGTEGNRKYLALHRSAPAGTILKVRNEMNNREVFVRVMGKLPDTALTDKVVIRISKSAYDRLAAIDQRFRVEVTYYK
ncbi:MAG TPA: LysM peptidoglycan-binding domain-containing protein [Chryseosolibacter sp.]|nr:LysM peptidoglycan-binding domain-containing protein [Chryseosolibacter sp.]